MANTTTGFRRLQWTFGLFLGLLASDCNSHKSSQERSPNNQTAGNASVIGGAQGSPRETGAAGTAGGERNVATPMGGTSASSVENGTSAVSGGMANSAQSTTASVGGGPTVGTTQTSGGTTGTVQSAGGTGNRATTGGTRSNGGTPGSVALTSSGGTRANAGSTASPPMGGTKASSAAGGTKAIGGNPSSGGTSTATLPADIVLPAPRLSDDAHPIPKALKKRQSTRDYSSAELTSQQQSEIIWAAFGVNRPSEGKRTAPTAWNCQDIDLYLATSAGAFKYNPAPHSLSLVSSSDVRSQLGGSYATAPLTIIYVSTQSKISGSDKVRYSYMHTGFIGMNVYLYAAYENWPVVIRSDGIPGGLAQSLSLTSDQAITLVQTIGLPAGQSNPDGVKFKEGALDAPRTSTHPILKALQSRKSASGFASTELPLQTIGEILWSGFGVNRDGGGRTAPTAHNYQDIDIYVTLASGSYRYDAASHVLKLLSTTDTRSAVNSSYKNAPMTLVYVSDYKKISSESDRERYSSAHTGFIAQNVNAYCASENLATRVYESITDTGALKTALQLTSDQHITLSQTVGLAP